MAKRKDGKPNRPKSTPKREVKRPSDPGPINPSFTYRWCEGPRFFGLGHTVLAAKIESGEIPEPISITDSGRARGWLGQQILDWQRERLAKAQAVALARKEKAAKVPA